MLSDGMIDVYSNTFTNQILKKLVIKCCKPIYFVGLFKCSIIHILCDMSKKRCKHIFKLSELFGETINSKQKTDNANK